MALPVSGRISLLDIKNEFGDPNNDGQFKFSEYYRGDGGNKVVRGISRNSAIATSGEIRASQFYNSTNIFLENTPSDNGWPGDGITGNDRWNLVQNVAQNFSFPEAYVTMSFFHDVTNSRIRSQWTSGHSQTYGLTGIGYHDYVGLETATWEVKYDVTSQSSKSGSNYLPYGPLPTDDNLDPGTYYSLNSPILFGWLCQANAGRPLANVRVQGLSFTLRATLGSDVFTSTYGTAEGPFEGPGGVPVPGSSSVYLQALYGDVTAPIKAE